MKSKHFPELWLVEDDNLNLTTKHEDVIEQMEEEESSNWRQHNLQLWGQFNK